MEKIYDLYERYRDYILFFILFIIMILCCGFIFWYFFNDISDVKEKLKDDKIISQKEVEVKNEIIVDIKGEVKKPGVYVLEEGKRVIDVIKKAGGFTKNADSSVNNLSKKITDEMVIVIYSKKEVKDYLKSKEEKEKSYEMCNNEIIVNDSCISNNDSSGNVNNSVSNDDKSNVNKENSSSEKVNDNDSNTDNKLISINTASLEELMTLPSIGEAKARAIIEYREKEKFSAIWDIKNVSGIGDALFEKIKDYITT